MHLIAKNTSSSIYEVFDELLDKPREFNISLKTNVTSSMKYNYDIRFFVQGLEKEVFLPISEDLLAVIIQKGWMIFNKIGKGAYSTVFLVKNLKSGVYAALIIDTNFLKGDEDITPVEKVFGLQKEGYFKGLATIYELFRYRSLLTLDKTYSEYDEQFTDEDGFYMISIIELVTPLHYLKRSDNLVKEVKTQLSITLSELSDQDLEYRDIKDQNMGLDIYGYLKLIDLASINEI